MMRYRTLLLGLIGLFLAGCAGYDYDDSYDRGYGRGGYGTVYSAPYRVQQYEVYSAPRYYSAPHYYSAPPVYRAPPPRYYVPAPPPRHHQPHRAPVQQGWNQPPRGYHPAPGRTPDRQQARRRDAEHGRNDQRHDTRGQHSRDDRRQNR